MGLISAKALLRPGLLGTIQFPAELFDRDWEKVEYVASREEFTFLATMKLVVGMGSRAGVKRLRLTGPLSRAYENAAREAKLTRLSRSRPPLEFLHRMQADRQFVRKVQIIEHVDPETRVAVRTGKWYWEHKTTADGYRPSLPRSSEKVHGKSSRARVLFCDLDSQAKEVETLTRDLVGGEPWNDEEMVLGV